MEKLEKSGIITNVGLAENVENDALRIEIETAQTTDLSELANEENVTGFLLANKQQTLFSTRGKRASKTHLKCCKMN